jgi:hypothetical protein
MWQQPKTLSTELRTKIFTGAQEYCTSEAEVSKFEQHMEKLDDAIELGFWDTFERVDDRVAFLSAMFVYACTAGSLLPGKKERILEMVLGQGYDELCHAVYHGQIKIVNTLLPRSQIGQVQPYINPLYLAYYFDHVDIMLTLLSYGMQFHYLDFSLSEIPVGAGSAIHIGHIDIDQLVDSEGLYKGHYIIQMAKLLAAIDGSEQDQSAIACYFSRYAEEAQGSKSEVRETLSLLCSKDETYTLFSKGMPIESGKKYRNLIDFLQLELQHRSERCRAHFVDMIYKDQMPSLGKEWGESKELYVFCRAWLATMRRSRFEQEKCSKRSTAVGVIFQNASLWLEPFLDAIAEFLWLPVPEKHSILERIKASWKPQATFTLEIAAVCGHPSGHMLGSTRVQVHPQMGCFTVDAYRGIECSVAENPVDGRMICKR